MKKSPKLISKERPAGNEKPEMALIGVKGKTKEEFRAAVIEAAQKMGILKEKPKGMAIEATGGKSEEQIKADPKDAMRKAGLLKTLIPDQPDSMLVQVRQRATPERLLWLNTLSPREARMLESLLKRYGIESFLDGIGWEGYRDDLEEARKFYP